MPIWLYKVTTGNFVTNKTLFNTFQKSHWLKFARFLCNAESRCLSTTDFRRWSKSQYCTTSKTSVLRPRGTYLSGTFLFDCELSDWAEGGNLPSWLKKQRALSPRFLSLALSVSFFPVFNKRNYILPKGWQLLLIFHTYNSNKYQPFRLADMNKGHACVAPIGDSLKMRLVPGPRHAK